MIRRRKFFILCPDWDTLARTSLIAAETAFPDLICFPLIHAPGALDFVQHMLAMFYRDEHIRMIGFLAISPSLDLKNPMFDMPLIGNVRTDFFHIIMQIRPTPDNPGYFDVEVIKNTGGEIGIISRGTALDTAVIRSVRQTLLHDEG